MCTRVTLRKLWLFYHLLNVRSPWVFGLLSHVIIWFGPTHFKCTNSVRITAKICGHLEPEEIYVLHKQNWLPWFEIQTAQMEISSHRTDAIQGLQLPRNINEFIFSPLCSLYRRCVPTLERMASPPSQELEKGEPRQLKFLTEEDIKNVVTWRGTLISASVARRSLKNSLKLAIYVCYRRTGCVLMNDQPNRIEKPLDYRLHFLRNAYKTMKSLIHSM